MLDYSCSSPDTRKFSPHPDLSSQSCLEFDPPVPGDDKSYQLKTRDTASIVLVIEGGGRYQATKQSTENISPGSVLFLPADEVLEVFPENCSRLVIFQAYCNL